MAEFVKIDKDVLIKLANEIKKKADFNVNVKFSELWMIVRDVVTDKHPTKNIVTISDAVPDAINGQLHFSGEIVSASDGETVFVPLSTVDLYSSLSNFGDATANDVAEGKTFTSASGLKVVGTAKIDTTEAVPVSLTSISASYTGANVLVGTKITNIGIVVIGNYSDGSKKPITDWTSSDTVKNGSNNYTITYNSKSATVTVTGYQQTVNPNSYNCTNEPWTIATTKYGWADINEPIDWVIGNRYTVTFDGKLYDCVIKSYVSSSGDTRMCLGNQYLETGTNSTGEPFCVIKTSDEVWLDATYGTHTILFKKVDTSTQPSEPDSPSEETVPSTPPTTETYSSTFSCSMKTDNNGQMACYVGSKPNKAKFTIGSESVEISLTSPTTGTYAQTLGAKYCIGTTKSYKIYVFFNDYGIMANVVQASSEVVVKQTTVTVTGTCASRTRTNPSPKSGFVYRNGTKFYRNGAHYHLKSMNARLCNIYVRSNESGFYWGTSRELNATTYSHLKSLGFNSVKLVFGYGVLDNWDKTFSEIDKNIAWAKAQGMTLQLNCHNLVVDQSTGRYNIETQEFLSSSGATLQNNYINMWKKIAEKYANESTIIGYGLLNEPIVPHGTIAKSGCLHWWYSDLMQRTINAIRTVDTNHVLFVDRVLTIEKWGSSYNSTYKNTWGNYFQFPLVDDYNTSIEWHDYEPMYFGSGTTSSSVLLSYYKTYPNGAFPITGMNHYDSKCTKQTFKGTDGKSYTLYVTNQNFLRYYMKEITHKAELMYGEHMYPVLIGEWGGSGVSRNGYKDTEANNSYTTFVKDKIKAFDDNGYYGSFHTFLGVQHGYIDQDPTSSNNPWDSSKARLFLSNGFKSAQV